MADDDRAKASTSGQPGVGCAQCWPATADDAWRARQGLVRAAELIDDFHLHVMLLACPACRQSFLSVFTEIVDWADGMDPQSWMLTPVTATEVAALTARGSELSEAELNMLGCDRRTLWHDHPKGGPATSVWIGRMKVGRHD
jgi:uncharacterized protein YbaR (Trm112 family)